MKLQPRNILEHVAREHEWVTTFTDFTNPWRPMSESPTKLGVYVLLLGEEEWFALWAPGCGWCVPNTSFVLAMLSSVRFPAYGVFSGWKLQNN